MNALSLSSQRRGSPKDIAPLPSELARDGLIAGLISGGAMTITGALLAAWYGFDVWVPLKALGSLVLGSAALGSAGFVAGPVLVGLLIHLIVAALLGAIFAIVTRQLWRLPSDFGLPAVSGLVFGLVVWLVVYLAIPAFIPQLFSIAAPAFIIQHIVYGTLTGLIFAKLRPQPYTMAAGR